MSLRLLIPRSDTHAIEDKLTIRKDTSTSKHDLRDDVGDVYLFDACDSSRSYCTYYIPLSYALKLSYPTRPIERWMSTSYDCSITLREYQREPYEEAKKTLLSSRTCFVKGSCGTGKTTFGIMLGHTLGYKSMIVVHRDSIATGWMKAFTRDTSARVSFVEDTIDPDADVYIIMVMRLKKFTRKDLDCIGTLVVDEARYISSPVWSRLLLRIQPRYICGLCAEDSLPDGSSHVLDYLYGTERILMTNDKPFTVFKYETEFQPRIELAKKGKFKGRPMWNVIEDSTYNNVKRCYLIACVVAREAVEHKSIVICRLKNQATTINSMLIDMSVDSALLIGSSKTCHNSRVLVTNRSKASVGFDASNFIPDYDGEPISAVFMCMSVLLIEQSKGRGDRADNPILCLFVDNYHTFRKHYKANAEWIHSHRGRIITLTLE